MPASVLIQTRFTKHRQFATSFSAAGLPVGNLLGPIVSNRLISAFGWRGAMLLQAGITLNILVLVCMWPRRNRTVDSNADVDAASKRGCSRFIDLSVLLDPLVALLTFAGMLYRFVNLTIMDHVPSRCVFLGYSKEDAASLITVMFFGGCIEREHSNVRFSTMHVQVHAFMQVVSCLECRLGST